MNKREREREAERDDRDRWKRWEVAALADSNAAAVSTNILCCSTLTQMRTHARKGGV